ncbi:MAG: ABC transporter substrate-binding protein, partial [Chloroflexota bacterium]
MKQKYSLIVALMLCLVLMASACAPVAAPSGDAGGNAAAEEASDAGGDAIKIGVLTPLSSPGDTAAGQLVQRGAELAAEYVNTEMGGVLGGMMVELAIEDDQGTPEVGVAGYRRLATEEGVVGVIGQYHSSVNLAVNEVAKEIGVPVFSTQASNKDVTAKQYPIAFRTHAIDPIRAESWISFINDNGFTKIAIISEDTDYGIGLVEEMETRTADTDIELNAVVFSRGTVDITPQ